MSHTPITDTIAEKCAINGHPGFVPADEMRALEKKYIDLIGRCVQNDFDLIREGKKREALEMEIEGLKVQIEEMNK